MATVFGARTEDPNNNQTVKRSMPSLTDAMEHCAIAAHPSMYIVAQGFAQGAQATATSAFHAASHMIKQDDSSAAKSLQRH